MTTTRSHARQQSPNPNLTPSPPVALEEDEEEDMDVIVPVPLPSQVESSQISQVVEEEEEVQPSEEVARGADELVLELEVEEESESMEVEEEEEASEDDMEQDEEIEEALEEEEEEEEEEEVVEEEVEEEEDEEELESDASRSDGETEAIQWEMQQLQDTVPSLRGEYKLIDRLGEGTFSSVYKAIDLRHASYDNSLWQTASSTSASPQKAAAHEGRAGKVYVALKRIYVTSSPLRIFNELDILHDLRGSRNVAFLIAALRHDDQVIAVMPFNRHQDFRTYYRTATLPLLRSYFASLFRALASTHEQHIIHRDVKPANFLYDTRTGTGTLCDYGLAQKVGGDEWFEWKAECLHSLPGPSWGGREGRKRSAKKIERDRAAGGHSCDSPGLAAGLHGAALLKPVSLYEQTEKMAVDWMVAESELVDGDPEDGPVAPGEYAKLLKMRPWQAKGHLRQELRARWKEQASWYKNWSRAGTAAGGGERVGYLKEDRRPSVRANRAGTRGFRAPEVLLKCPDQTVSLDIWSAGIILLCFLTKRFPFFNSNDDTEALVEIAAIFGRRKIEKCAVSHNRTFLTNIPTLESPPHASLHALVKSLNPALFVEHSPNPYGPIPSTDLADDEWYNETNELFLVVDLMKRCLDLDGTRRWTAEECLEHPFFDSGEFEVGPGRTVPRSEMYR